MASSSSSILGHTAQLAALEQDLVQGNVAHAYLFSGARHLGKFTVAKWFANHLLCHGRSDEECDRIRRQTDRLIHPDLLVLDQLWMEDVCEDPDVIARSSNIDQHHRVKAKAKTDTISIDDVRALQERLHDVSGGYRCCLIRSVERMQAEAVNALLKILEEPPAGVVFVLTTQSLSALLPTLVSRTRVLHFARLTEQELGPLLAASDDDERQFLVRVAQGAPGIVTILRDNPDAMRSQRQIYGNALAFWHSRSPMERLSLLKPLYERGKEADDFLLHLSLAYREERAGIPGSAVGALMQLSRILQSNVNRQLAAQQFVMELGM